MNLRVAAHSTLQMTPELDQKGKQCIARKGKKKLVSGNTFKSRTGYKKMWDFITASRGAAVMSKAHYESQQYVQAAVLRKNKAAALHAQVTGMELSDEDYDSLVWNSSGVQNRAIRQDHIRFNKEYFSEEQGASKNNQKAHRISGWAHDLHGLCEMNAAPTGMTTTLMRNTVAYSADEKSNKNKWFMAIFLVPVALATTLIVDSIRYGIYYAAGKEVPQFLGQSILNIAIAFPACSSALGAATTTVGACSQYYAEKQRMGQGQKDGISKQLNTNLNHLLFRLKQAKDNPQLTKVYSDAMQGRHLIGKVGKSHCNPDGTPKLLAAALDAIDLTKSDTENLLSMQDAMGDYLQVEKPIGESATKWARYRYAKAVTAKESHFVALASLVNHSDIQGAPKHLQDKRRKYEEKKAPEFHQKVLKAFVSPASVIDKHLGSNMAEKLTRWSSDAYIAEQKAKMLNPENASQNHLKGEYMVKNMHQYGKWTRRFILLSEGTRLANMNLVLASNANLSRVFNNLASNIQAAVGTGPASRTMCFSIGRFFGGAVLALLIGGVFVYAGDVTVGKYTKEVAVGDGNPVNPTISPTSVGLVMFALSVPTLLFMGAAQVAARLEGWNGNKVKEAPTGTKTFQWRS